MDQEQVASAGVDRPVVKVKRLVPSASLPAYAHHDDAGADIAAAETVTLQPGERALVATGIAIELPVGYACFVHPRSGLAHKHGVSIVNAPGTIDAGYRGEIKVNLINLDPLKAVTLNPGDRIGQLVIQQVSHARFLEADELGESERGFGGHGSTGGFTA
ncbi:MULTISPECIES: dUTP diphosphatase [Micrococcaceae]|uniref:dUTP diphosphatase n=1 Tax=Micrococcaceae TaxID=1268 RepID=UPI0006898CEF|nr:deoxyuridine 5'-triphosphate nucleotidohydrolase [Arthrobacter sp. HMSC08H08]OFT43210.1 deoxyuridine 5'-triphosphate nucleotidohydrolase [Arthrobacter sp. HMSC06H05]